MTIYLSALFQNIELYKLHSSIKALDGKHVVMQAPPNADSMRFKYKRTFTTVLMALVNADNLFIVTDVGCYMVQPVMGKFWHNVYLEEG